MTACTNSAPRAWKACGRRAEAFSRARVLFHTVNHGTYHRGAIGHALDLAGAPRPADTYTCLLYTS
ncbi:DinB family protein, partial [Pseudomonas aeruginosa]|nr:DinB family protein [Pseudomonas aeruginosa]